MYVFDIEADSLNATKIHCLSYSHVSKPNEVKTLTSYNDMREFLLKAECLIGHNITLYDIPTLERILGIKNVAKLVDTLALSWYCQPDRIRHSLASYGVEYDLLKKEIEDWVGLELHEYVERCERDVEINLRLWQSQYVFLKRLYGSDQESWRLIRYLAFKMDCAAAQEATGWRVDIERCKAGIEELSADRLKKVEELKLLMPPVPVYKTKTKPVKMFKQNGQLSKAGEDWLELSKLHPVENDSITYVAGYEDPNPNSIPQLKEYLTSLGWVPDEFKHVRNKDDGSIKKIPQINTQIPGETGVSASVRLLFNDEPRLEVLEGLSVINHRLGLLKGFLDSADEKGFVKASIQGFTNTLRFIHKTVVNLPKVGKLYGELIRGCLIAPDGEELCGADMSSLEDRIKQHFLMPHDPEYVAKMAAPDYDPHLTFAEAAGAITSAEHEGYKKEKDKFKHVKAIRSTFKNGNYAAQYLAGGKRIALTCGVPEEKGIEMHKAYWKLNWAIKAVAEELLVKTLDGQMWLFNPVSRLYYSLRYEKDKFSTLCQGTAAWCFDLWVGFVRSKRKPVLGQFHDECIWSIKIGHRDSCNKLLIWAIEETNNKLKLNRRLDIDIQYGRTYAEIH